eukprot:TRINITY_DN2768_c0_g1_i2.p1 TRINITY_DN2768_c0_g1~~TRINITY_DN2768_c0_g1_i2.p1  ORF type:complete len:146 (-),score=29.50 TRINITY_DN2768_c0_g1_i2:66-503(-)
MNVSQATSIYEKLEPRDDKQLAWIDKILCESAADWLIVAGHYPVYSGGSHGNTQELEDNLKPLLEKYHVDLYLSGHDHTLQYLKHHNVHYVVSGSGSKSSTYKPIPQSVWGTVSPGFTLNTVSLSSMKIDFLVETGVAYSFTIQK